MYNYSQYNPNDYTMANVNMANYMMPNTNAGNYMPTTGSQYYSPAITNSYEGFIRGNMFVDLYDPYVMGEPFNLTPVSEREAMLNKVRECDFAAIDLGLYLDTNPNDAEKIKAYNQCIMQGRKIREEFESRYGPLTLESETLNSYPWAWIASPWPWEVI